MIMFHNGRTNVTRSRPQKSRMRPVDAKRFFLSQPEPRLGFQSPLDQIPQSPADLRRPQMPHGAEQSRQLHERAGTHQAARGESSGTSVRVADEGIVWRDKR